MPVVMFPKKLFPSKVAAPGPAVQRSPKTRSKGNKSTENPDANNNTPTPRKTPTTPTTAASVRKPTPPTLVVRRQKRKLIVPSKDAFGSLESKTYKKILKKIHPDLEISQSASAAMDYLMSEIFYKLALGSKRLLKYRGTMTLTTKDIQTAADLLIGGELFELGDQYAKDCFARMDESHRAEIIKSNVDDVSTEVCDNEEPPTSAAAKIKKKVGGATGNRLVSEKST